MGVRLEANQMRVNVIAVLALVLAGVAYGNKQAPLPERIVQAKTLFVDNQSKYADVADRFYEEMGKWKRFRIVLNRVDADLIVVLTTQESEGIGSYNRPYVTNKVGNTDITTGGSSVYSYTYGSTQIAFLDPKSGEKVWSNTMAWGRKGGARGLVRDLRKRVESQEKKH